MIGRVVYHALWEQYGTVVAVAFDRESGEWSLLVELTSPDRKYPPVPGFHKLVTWVHGPCLVEIS